MSEAKVTEGSGAPATGVLGFLRRKLPYVAVLVLAITGIAFTNISQQPLNGYWEFLTIVMALVCIATGWPHAPDRESRTRLIWTQALHWATFLVTMNMVLLPGFQGLLPVPASSLVLLMLLALGTVLAGINLLSLEIGFLGLALALSVPALVWLKTSALFLLLAAVAVFGLGVAFWPRGRNRNA
jgi:hypothetical protein